MCVQRPIHVSTAITRTSWYRLMRPVKERGNDMHDGFEVSGSWGGVGWVCVYLFVCGCLWVWRSMYERASPTITPAIMNLEFTGTRSFSFQIIFALFCALSLSLSLTHTHTHNTHTHTHTQHTHTHTHTHTHRRHSIFLPTPTD